jgi:hypothetical protein
MKVYIVLATAESIESKFTIVTKVFYNKESAETFINNNESCPKERSVGDDNYDLDYLIEEHEVSE